MKEIKFRAYHKPQNFMYWFDVMWGSKHGIGGGYIGMLPFGRTEVSYSFQDFRVAVDPNDCEIMQYTGLKDLNGKEIYEGDIVKGISDVYYEVHFFDGIFGTRIGPIASLYLEVVGNIYETPELLTPLTSI